MAVSIVYIRESLRKGNSVIIHQRNLQVLTIEFFLGKNDISPEILEGTSELKELSYSSRSLRNDFYVEITTHYCIQSINYLVPKIWNLIPHQIKHCGSLTKSKDFIMSSMSLSGMHNIYCESRIHWTKYGNGIR